MQKELRGKIEIGINELKEYRSQCLMNGLGYYDAFKNKKRSNLDFHANLKRLELAALWDEIGLLENFQYGEDWRRLATHYMLLVEPLDIANYYRLGKNEDSGPYLTHGRPRRYKSFHKWLEDDEENNQLLSLPAGTDQLMLTQDSCLWAYVEEITYLIGENIVGDQENLVAEFEERLRRLFDSNGLCMEELVCGKSTFKMAVKWLWDRKTPQKKTGSCLCCIIDKHPELLE